MAAGYPGTTLPRASKGALARRRHGSLYGGTGGDIVLERQESEGTDMSQVKNGEMLHYGVVLPDLGFFFSLLAN